MQLMLLLAAAALANPIPRLKYARSRTPGVVKVTTTPDPGELWDTMTLGFGTPPQYIDCILDTGSNDLWVALNTPAVCSSDPNADNGIDCSEPHTLFTPNSSATFKSSGQPFQASYINWEASGEYVTDTITVGGVKVPNATFALVNQSSAPKCIFGLGSPYYTAMVTGIKNGEYFPSYDTLPTLLQKHDYTSSNAVTFAIGAGSNTVLFGGLDLAQIEGTIWKIPGIEPGSTAAHIAQPLTVLSGVSVVSRDGSVRQIADLSWPVGLDTGTDLIRLPSEILGSLMTLWPNWSWSDNVGAFTGPCTSLDMSSSFVFNILGVNLTVPFDSLIGPIACNVCATNLYPGNGSDYALLGYQFMQQVSLSLGFDDNSMLIAQANPSPAGSNVVMLSDNAISGVLSAPNYGNTMLSHSIHTYT